MNLEAMQRESFASRTGSDPGRRARTSAQEFVAILGYRSTRVKYLQRELRARQANGRARGARMSGASGAGAAAAAARGATTRARGGCVAAQETCTTCAVARVGCSQVLDILVTWQLADGTDGDGTSAASSTAWRFSSGLLLWCRVREWTGCWCVVLGSIRSCSLHAYTPDRTSPINLCFRTTLFPKLPASHPSCRPVQSLRRDEAISTNFG